MLSTYPACFFKEGTGYSVIFPDLNYLATCGETLDEAQIMAVDCLAGRLYLMCQDKETFPEPSALEDIDLSDVCRELEISPTESFVNFITVDFSEYAKTHFEKTVRKVITIPSWLNAAAQDHNINFSQVLQDTLKERLGVQTGA